MEDEAHSKTNAAQGRVLSEESYSQQEIASVDRVWLACARKKNSSSQAWDRIDIKSGEGEFASGWKV